MCNLYEIPDEHTLQLQFDVELPGQSWGRTASPLAMGVYIRAGGVAEVGQWGMIPPSSKERTPKTREGRRMSTNNARRETMANAWTYRGPWARGQRCLVPATSYDEPYWGISHADPMTITKNTWWRFWRADGKAWALAGLWSEWTDPVTGEVVHNYTICTQNCDAHPLLNLMHKPDPKMPPNAQDKRAVVPIEAEDWEQWLHGTKEEAESLIKVPPIGVFRHGPADPIKGAGVVLPLA